MNKKIIIGITIFLFVLILVIFIPKLKEKDVVKEEKSEEEQNGVDYTRYKTLIIYYSKSKTTERIANLLQKKIGADLYKIEVVEDYPEGMTEIYDRAKEERDSGNLPLLKGTLPDISRYDLILVGSPVWARTISTPIMSYLAQTDFDGKRVATFYTDIGKAGTYEKDFNDQIQNASPSYNLELTDASELGDAEIDVLFDKWLKKVFK